MSRNNSVLLSISAAGVITPIDTFEMFEAGYTEPDYSPIDQYIQNSNKLTRIYLNNTVSPDLSQELGNIILLGFMSAVESYLRAILRGVICIDEHAQKLVEKNDVSYAAALHHNKKMLPEALFETSSFASKKNILDTLKDSLGIKGQPSSDLEKALDEYSKICHLRHCCVHRFGKLGASNAASLGLKSHSKYIEKPVNFDGQKLQQISLALRSFILTLNNHIFEKLLDRMAINKDDKGNKIYLSDWKWQFSKDKARFNNYYDLFKLTVDASSSPNVEDVYSSYKQKYR